ncbi:serine hydrolase [Saccharibacillus sacchari]|uniref:Serine hydrolase n=1 Tax=Saccharibacillus sacchari TaxID=456493 RepID=A0ACC6PH05_9BACL
MSSHLNLYTELPAFIERSGLEVNGLVMLQKGRPVLEWYREPYRRGVPQLLYSLSKSFASIAVGIACDQGRLKLDDTVLSFFPDKRPDEITPRLSAMRIRHLLSMTAGHEQDIYPIIVSQQDWASTFLAQPVEKEPGTHYRYSTMSTYMLSAIVERVSGMNLVDFLMPTLFEPLGIARPVWETCPLGVTAGGMGLSLSTEDVAKFGQMLLEGGAYNGKRIVSAEYVALASTEQSDNRVGVSPQRIDSRQGYGFQFHLCRFRAYRGDGSFGQLCLVSPKHDLVVAANCAFPSMGKLQPLLHRIFELSGEKTELPFQMDRMYRLDDNPAELHAVTFCAAPDGFDLTMEYGGKEARSEVLPFAYDRSVETQGVFVKDLMLHRQRVITSIETIPGDATAVRLTLRYIETPYVVTYTVQAVEEQIRLNFAINVSFGFKSYEISGHA